jgi:hypothetical protein
VLSFLHFAFAFYPNQGSLFVAAPVYHMIGAALVLKAALLIVRVRKKVSIDTITPLLISIVIYSANAVVGRHGWDCVFLATSAGLAIRHQ